MNIPKETLKRRESCSSKSDSVCNSKPVTSKTISTKKI